MKIKIYYRRNLKISPAKLASSCSHVANQLGYMLAQLGEYNEPQDVTVVVLKASDKKFNEIKDEIQSCEDYLCHLHVDKGLSEVEPNTSIAFGWVD